MEEFEATLKSCIISRKGGVPIQELNSTCSLSDQCQRFSTTYIRKQRNTHAPTPILHCLWYRTFGTEDYKDLVGESIPFKKLGHASLLELLMITRGVKVTASGMVFARGDNTANLEKLIRNQKTNVKVKKFHGIKKAKENQYKKTFISKNVALRVLSTNEINKRKNMPNETVKREGDNRQKPSTNYPQNRQYNKNRYIEKNYNLKNRHYDENKYNYYHRPRRMRSYNEEENYRFTFRNDRHRRVNLDDTVDKENYRITVENDLYRREYRNEYDNGWGYGRNVFNESWRYYEPSWTYGRNMLDFGYNYDHMWQNNRHGMYY